MEEFLVGEEKRGEGRDGSGEGSLSSAFSSETVSETDSIGGSSGVPTLILPSPSINDAFKKVLSVFLSF